MTELERCLVDAKWLAICLEIMLSPLRGLNRYDVPELSLGIGVTGHGTSGRF